jgi:hypothetical protein
LSVIVVESRDDVAGANTGFCRRRLVDRRDHLDEAILHRDFDPEPAELAAGLDLHVAEILRIKVARMRIKAVEHAVDCALDQFGVVGLLDIVRAHALKYVSKQIELPVRIGTGCPRAYADPLRRLGDQNRESNTDGHTKENQRRLAHHLETFSLSVPLIHADENTIATVLEPNR